MVSGIGSSDAPITEIEDVSAGTELAIEEPSGNLPEMPEAGGAGKAMVFLRPSGARHHGHVGWAFSLPGGGSLAGGVEMPNMSLRLWQAPSRMGFWSLLVEDAEGAMTAPPNWRQWNSRYDLYKEIPVEAPDIRKALREVKKVSNTTWRLIGQNCMNATFQILSAYGAPDLPTPSFVWGPIRFFNDIDVPVKVIKEPIAVVDATMYAGRDLSDKRYAVVDNGGCPDLSTKEWENTARSIVVRAGYLAIYSEPGYRGKILKIAPKTALNLGEPGDEFRVCSYWACEDDFDPEKIAEHPYALRHTGLQSGPAPASSPSMPHSLRGGRLIPRIEKLD